MTIAHPLTKPGPQAPPVPLVECHAWCPLQHAAGDDYCLRCPLRWDCPHGPFVVEGEREEDEG